MKILITGGTGFIGQALVPLLCTEHKVTVLTRSPNKAKAKLGEIPRLILNLDQLKSLDKFDVVINLAGEPIAEKPWTHKQKAKLCHSRWDVTAKLVELCQKSDQPPHTFISASAVGYYGRQKATPVDENSVPHNEFTHHLCQEWERLALLAQTERTRVCIMRIGVVLDSNGGALQRMITPFKLGLGGKIASGQQGMSWIHRRDVIRIIQYLMKTSSCNGVYNTTSPNPVSNKLLTKTLARSLHRPALFPLPRFVAEKLFGEMADILTEGQYVVPQRLLDEDFKFSYPTIDSAMAQIFPR
ncbi:TIGR01777 family protein [Parashewanella curva]|uniref:TIGR01777 family protein n=2 Tax=Parashewanella curva TaxID=2338552 RepID=A0A3L8PU25_9GAMM|nr:TIGR01777 family oxidoreductase [Parashewanella curva]RLV58804.1 TIGR01777 family protein [Parashewanella curva]